MAGQTSKKSAKVASKAAKKAAKPRKAVTKSSALKPTKAADAGEGIPRTILHKDGSIYAKGRMLGGKMHGYWEFFRKDGTIMRSGSFDREQQIGTWVTYDSTGKPVKSTEMKAGAKAKPTAKAAKPQRAVATSSARRPKAAAKPKLLSGGNPQIAKADGDAPVQAYIAAMPGWKRDVGRRLDSLIVRTVPDARKAVRWNSPFYGIEGQGWFLSFHCISKYVKVGFFRGASLRPLPPVESRQKDVRYFHVHEGDQLDEELVASWIRQASALPGETCF